MLCSCVIRCMNVINCPLIPAYCPPVLHLKNEFQKNRQPGIMEVRLGLSAYISLKHLSRNMSALFSNTFIHMLPVLLEIYSKVKSIPYSNRLPKFRSLVTWSSREIKSGISLAEHFIDEESTRKKKPTPGPAATSIPAL